MTERKKRGKEGKRERGWPQRGILIVSAFKCICVCVCVSCYHQQTHCYYVVAVSTVFPSDFVVQD